MMMMSKAQQERERERDQKSNIAYKNNIITYNNKS